MASGDHHADGAVQMRVGGRTAGDCTQGRISRIQTQRNAGDRAAGGGRALRGVTAVAAEQAHSVTAFRRLNHRTQAERVTKRGDRPASPAVHIAGERIAAIPGVNGQPAVQRFYREPRSAAAAAAEAATPEAAAAGVHIQAARRQGKRKPRQAAAGAATGRRGGGLRSAARARLQREMLIGREAGQQRCRPQEERSRV